MGLISLETSIDIIFFLDIVINFFTAYVDSNRGAQISQPKLIAKNYFKGGFILDFISTTPLVLRPLINAVTEQGSNLNELLELVVTSFRFTKLLRVRKVSTLITNLHQPVSLKSQLKRLYVIFMLVLICHIQGCIIFIIVYSDKQWIPPLNFGTFETEIFDNNENYKGFLFTYFKMVYHSSLVYAMVDITVRSEHELLFTSFLIIVSAIINAIIYGQFANLTEDLKENSNIFLRKLDLVNSVMASEHLPMELKDNVREHILTTH